MEKVGLPTKTKIAAWWMIIFGIIFLGYQISILYPSYRLWKDYGEFGFNPLSAAALPIIFNTLIFLLPGIFLIKKKKIAWNFAIAIFLLIFIGSLFRLGIDIFQEGLGSLDKLTFLFYLSMIIPFILLLSDRKNFWKIAT